MGREEWYKQKFNMKITCTIKQIRELMQIGRTWCNVFSNDNFKFKL
jgi:hypothetical protein